MTDIRNLSLRTAAGGAAMQATPAGYIISNGLIPPGEARWIAAFLSVARKMRGERSEPLYIPSLLF